MSCQCQSNLWSNLKKVTGKQTWLIFILWGSIRGTSIQWYTEIQKYRPETLYCRSRSNRYAHSHSLRRVNRYAQSPLKAFGIGFLPSRHSWKKKLHHNLWIIKGFLCLMKYGLSWWKKKTTQTLCNTTTRPWFESWITLRQQVCKMKCLFD